MFDEAFKKLYVDGRWTSYLKCMKCNQLLKINTKTSKLTLTQHMSQHDGQKRQRKSLGGTQMSHHISTIQMGQLPPHPMGQIMPVGQSIDHSQPLGHSQNIKQPHPLDNDGYVKQF